MFPEMKLAEPFQSKRAGSAGNDGIWKTYSAKESDMGQVRARLTIQLTFQEQNSGVAIKNIVSTRSVRQAICRI